MKKILLILLLAIPLSGMWAKSNNPVRLMKGSLNVLQNPATKLFVEIDYTKTKIEGKSLEAYLDSIGRTMKSWNETDEEGIRYFTEKWEDDYDKGARIVSKKEDANHILRIRVNKLTLGNRAASAFALGVGSTLSGYVDVVPVGETTPACTLEVLEMHGTVARGTVGGDVGRLWVLNDLSENICKILRKLK